MVAELHRRLHALRRLRGELTPRSTRSRAAACPPPIPGTVTTKGVVVGDFEGTAAASGLLPPGPDRRRRPRHLGRHLRLHRQRATSSAPARSCASPATPASASTRRRSTARTATPPPCRRPTSSHCGTGSVTPTDVTLPFAERRLPRALRGHARPLPAAARHLRVLQLRPLRRDRPRPAARRRDPALHRDRDRRAGRRRERPHRWPTACAGSRSTTPRAPRTRRSLRHPNGDPFSLTNRFRGGDTVAERRRRPRLRLQPVPHLPDRAGRLHGRQPAPGGARAGRRHRPRRGDEHAQLLRHRRLPDGQPARQQVRPAARTSSAAAGTRDQPTEFTRQRDKLLAALAGLDADIIGLNELENTTGVEPLADIVAGPARLRLHRHRHDRHRRDQGRPDLPPGRRDAGRRLPDSSTAPSTRASSTPRTGPSLAQTFEVNATGARFTVVGQPPQVEGLRLQRRRRPRPRRRPGQLQPDPRRSPPRRSSTGWRPTRPAAAIPTS